MSERRSWLSRRKFFIGLGAAGLAGATLVGGRLAFSRHEDFIATMTRRALPDAVIPDEVLQQFAADIMQDQEGDRLANLDRLVQLSSALTTTGVDMLLGSLEKYKNFRRTVVTQFLLRSNYFTTDGGKNGSLEYYGYLPCGQNPFAQFR